MSGEEGRNRGIRTSRTLHSLFPLLSATELPEVTKVLNCKKIGRVRGGGGGGNTRGSRPPAYRTLNSRIPALFFLGSSLQLFVDCKILIVEA